MIELGPITLLRPWWLLLLPAAVAVVAWHRGRVRGLGNWRRTIDETLLQEMTRIGHVLAAPEGYRVPALLASAAVLSVALSGPALRDESAQAYRNLETLVVAIDMSPSITRGGALDDAQAAAAYVLSLAEGRPAALIVYTANAYLLGAPTMDPGSLEGFVSVLDADVMPDTGTRPDRALRVAGEVLRETEAKAAHIVLITDGGGVDAAALREAQGVRDAGWALTAVYVEPDVVHDDMPPGDEAALRNLVEAADGVVVDAQSPAAISAALTRDRTLDLATSGLTPLIFADYGRYLVILAMLTLLPAFRRRT